MGPFQWRPSFLTKVGTFTAPRLPAVRAYAVFVAAWSISYRHLRPRGSTGQKAYSTIFAQLIPSVQMGATPKAN
jgi:hypothetical protein